MKKKIIFIALALLSTVFIKAQYQWQKMSDEFFTRKGYDIHPYLAEFIIPVLNDEK